MDEGKAALEKGVEGANCLGRRLRSFGRNRPDADRSGQAVDGRGVDRQRSRHLAEPLRRIANCIDCENANDAEQQQDCKEAGPSRDLQKSTLS